MKKSILALIVVVFGSATCLAQQEMVLQHTHIVAKRINSNGVVTGELTSNFTYNTDGKLTHYGFPGYGISANYYYSGDYLTEESISHAGEQLTYMENNLFTYEEGRLKTKSHIMSQMGNSLFWAYDYYNDGRLERVDKRQDDEEEAHEHWLYEYEDEGRTVTESYCTSYVSQGMLLREKTTSHYDSDYTLSDRLIERFDVSGEPTSSELITYTESGQLEQCAIQVPGDGQWVNSRVTRYTYDEEDRVTEKADGSWSAENNDWAFTKRITYQLSEDGQTYTVSFFRKSNGEWVWDVYDNFDDQPVLYGSYLKAQQRALGYLVYDGLYGEGNINQFEITLELTKMPVYLETNEVPELPMGIYPNPTTGMVSVSGVNLRQAEVYNALGQLVATATGNGSQITVDLNGLPAGLYFVNITDSDGRMCVRKVVKQ